ncbi:MAG: XRE family transcriptional regulator [Pseudomonadota bacterium]
MGSVKNAIADEAAEIGKRVRAARKAKGLKLREVSEATGLSVPHLSKLENGKARLSVDLALELCVVLGVPAAHFFIDSQPRQRNRRSITRAGAGLQHPSDHVDFEVLCSDLADKRSLHWRVTVKPAPDAERRMRSHGGEEFIHVIAGELELYTEGYDPLRLSQGDSVTFDGEMPHDYRAVGDTPAVLLMSNEIPMGQNLHLVAWEDSDDSI